jgi:DNA-binding transcriptional LysR family regulator
MNLGFDLRTLQIFVAVVELHSVTKAAERHNIAASAVSKRISDLELTLATPLLRRLPRGVEPTSAGLALYHHALTMLSNAERMLGELADFAQNARGYVRLLANKSCIMQFLPQDLSDFFTLNSDIRVELNEDNSPGILKGIAEGEADIGIFAHGSANDSGLQTFDYHGDEMIVLVRDDHPLSQMASTTFAEALQYDLIGLDAITTWNSMLGVEAERVGKVLSLRYRVTSFDAIGRMVIAGLGIAVTPKGLLSAIPDPKLIGVSLAEPWARRRHMLAVRDRRLLAAPARILLDHLAFSAASSAIPKGGLLELEQGA